MAVKVYESGTDYKPCGINYCSVRLNRYFPSRRLDIAFVHKKVTNLVYSLAGVNDMPTADKQRE
jgi:hypothetical protein